MTRSSIDPLGSTPNPAPEPPAEPEALRRDAAATRAELANTVNALVAKTDVKARARRRANEVTGQVHDRAQEVTGQARDRTRQVGEHAVTVARERPATVAVVGGAAALAVVGGLVWARRNGAR